MTTSDTQPPYLRIVVITLFPESLQMLADSGISSRALQHGLWSLESINPRDYADNKHRRVDDRPYGGGPGMVMQAPPLRDAILAAKSALGHSQAPVIYLSPQGQTLTQGLTERLVFDSARLPMAASDGARPEEVRQKDYILLCGRYEGIDERLIQTYVDAEISIGDYVLSGGELAAMVLIDAMVRLLPGACGHDASAQQDSFSASMLDHEQYTRPEVFEGVAVPEVLQSGDHKAIEQWRQANALQRTRLRRPDLLS